MHTPCMTIVVWIWICTIITRNKPSIWLTSLWFLMKLKQYHLTTLNRTLEQYLSLEMSFQKLMKHSHPRKESHFQSTVLLGWTEPSDLSDSSTSPLCLKLGVFVRAFVTINLSFEVTLTLDSTTLPPFVEKLLCP